MATMNPADYGPWNALADILSAYVQKRSIDGAMKYADTFNQQAADLQNPKWKQTPVAPTKNGEAAWNDTMARLQNTGQVVNTDWLHKNPVPRPQHGLDAAVNSLNPYQNPNTDLRVNTEFPTAGSVASSMAGTQQAQEQAKPYDPEFAAQKAQHPEWFVGNTYVGNDDTARKDAYLAEGQKKVDDYKANQHRPYSGSVLNMMEDFAHRNNPTYAPMDPQKYVDQRMNQYLFTKDKEEHPDSYVGNRWIPITGDKEKDAATRKNAEVMNRMQEEKKAQALKDVPDQSYKFSTGMEKYGYTGEKEAPLTYDEYTEKLKEMKIHAMREMVKKYGVDAAGKAEKMIDDTINGKASTYGDKLLATQAQNINNTLMGVDTNGNIVRADMSKVPNRMRFLTALQQYNIAAERMGKPKYDMNIAKEILNSDNVASVNIDSGGTIHVFKTKNNGTTFDDGSTMQEVGTIQKSLSPKDVQASKDKALDRKSRENIANQSNKTKLMIANNHDATTRRGQDLSYSAKIYAANRKGSGSGGSGGKAAIGWQNKLSRQGELAYQSIGENGNGTTYSDEDDHNVQNYLDSLDKFMESPEADEDDIAWAKQEKERVSAKYQEGYEAYVNS